MARTRRLSSSPVTLTGSGMGAATETVFGTGYVDPEDAVTGRILKINALAEVDGAVADASLRLRTRVGAAGTSGTVVCDTGAFEGVAGKIVKLESEIYLGAEDETAEFYSHGKADLPGMTATALDDLTLNLIHNASAASETAVYIVQGEDKPFLATSAANKIDFNVELDEGGDAISVKHCAALTTDSIALTHAASPAGVVLWLHGGGLKADFSATGDADGFLVTAGSRVAIVTNATAASLDFESQIYFDEDTNRFVADVGGTDITLTFPDGARLTIYHHASASSFPAVYINDSGAPNLALEFTSPTTTSSTATVRAAYDVITPLLFDEDGDGLEGVLDDFGADAGYIDLATVGGRTLRVTDGTGGVQVYVDDDGATSSDRLKFVSPTTTDGSQSTITPYSVDDGSQSTTTTSTATLNATAKVPWVVTAESSSGSASASVTLLYADIHVMPIPREYGQ